jgi:hypothetical protein
VNAVDLFQLAEPAELVNLATGEISYDRVKLSAILQAVSKQYGLKIAGAMHCVWVRGLRDDFMHAWHHLLRAGYTAEAELLATHCEGGLP